jgi:hypothetical protein
MATAIGAYAARDNVKLRLGRATGGGDTADDILIAKYCDWVNGRMEQIMGRAVAPYTVAGPYLFDGAAVRKNGRMLPIKQGIQSVTVVRVKASTSASFQTVPIGDIKIRPHSQERPVGWPGTQLWMVDEPSSTNPMGMFPTIGMDTIEVTAVLGWAVIPDELTDVGETVTVRAFQARRTGQSDTVGADAQGQAIISRILAAEFREVLARYAWVPI